MQLPKSIRDKQSSSLDRHASRPESAKLLDIVGDGVRSSRVANPRSFRVIDTGGTTGIIVGGLSALGSTAYSGRGITALAVPMGSSAHQRVVRHHELLHANRSPVRNPRGYKKFSPYSLNAIEDCRVHGVYWEPSITPKSLNRDCLAVAMQDLRTLQQHKTELGRSIDSYNSSLVQAVRSLAIVNALYGYARCHVKCDQRAERMLLDTFGEFISDELQAIAHKAVLSRRQYQLDALTRFDALLMSPPSASGKGDGSGGYRPTERGIVDPTLPGNNSRVAALDAMSPMEVTELPRPVPNSRQAPKSAPARYGAILRSGRLARAIVSGCTSGLFLRRKRVESTVSILFDASGSMGVSTDRLAALCSQSPGSLVAYYSGHAQSGNLCVFARNGRRAESIPKHTLLNGNNVDYWAIRWLLQQPGPRIIVTDRGFCGGPAGQESAASALLAASIAHGDIAACYESYAAFASDCGIKGDF